MSFLRYTEGAIPGVKIKGKSSEEEKKAKNKKYEEGRFLPDKSGGLTDLPNHWQIKRQHKKNNFPETDDIKLIKSIQIFSSFYLL